MGDSLRKIIKFKLIVGLTIILSFVFLLDSSTTRHHQQSIFQATKAEKSYAQSSMPVENRDLKPLRKQSEVQIKLYKYLIDLSNRESVKSAAIKLNNGKQHNSCVYFVSEALRRVGYKVPLKICYTGNYRHIMHKDISLMHFLKKMGWQESKNLSELQVGDICFTTPDSEGHSTHTYIFMGWVDPQKHDYAYVCDNQSYDYATTLHVRNIKSMLKDKDPLYCFMYLEFYANPRNF